MESATPSVEQLATKPHESGALLEHLARVYGTRDLANVDPLYGMGKKAPDRSRTRTINVRMVFEGTSASFDDFVLRGIPIRMTLAQALEGRLNSTLAPNRLLEKDAAQELDPKTSFDPSTALVSSISLALPLNTLPQGVGIVTNGLPTVYDAMKREQTEDLAKELGVKPRNVNIVAHIPTSETGLPDTRQIPILKEVINGFHGLEVSKTFGGITARHLPRGIIFFPPEFARDTLKLMAPPASHNAAPAPEGCEQVYNSWVIVPMGHILSHIINLPSSTIDELGYVVYQLKYPDGTLLPFLLMDNWTLEHYSYDTIANAMVKIDQSRVCLADMYIELVPLTRDTWLNSCLAGQHLQPGFVAFTAVIQYTVFPRDFRDDGYLVCALSDKFPRLSMDMREQLTEEHRTTKQAKQSAAPVTVNE